MEWCGGVVWWSGVVEWCGRMVWWSSVVEWYGGLVWLSGVDEAGCRCEVVHWRCVVEILMWLS